MIICGIDVSPTSTGITKFQVDDNLNVIDKSFLGFSELKKKNSLINPNITLYPKFEDYIERELWMVPKIFDFISSSDYVAIESYAYGGNGNITMIAEFTGLLKSKIYDAGIKMRFYDPQTIKFFATDSGKAQKPAMYNSFIELHDEDKIDLTELPTVTEKKTNGVSPTSDLIDSWFIAKILLTELRLRKGLVSLSDLPEQTIKIFNRVTKANPTNILATEFFHKTT